MTLHPLEMLAKEPESFFKQLDLDSVDIDFSQSEDVPGFKIEDQIGELKVVTGREDYQEAGKPQHRYNTILCDETAEPIEDYIVAKKQSPDFEQAIRTHYASLKCLSDLEMQNDTPADREI